MHHWYQRNLQSFLGSSVFVIKVPKSGQTVSGIASRTEIAVLEYAKLGPRHKTLWPESCKKDNQLTLPQINAIAKKKQIEASLAYPRKKRKQFRLYLEQQYRCKIEAIQKSSPLSTKSLFLQCFDPAT